MAPTPRGRSILPHHVPQNISKVPQKHLKAHSKYLKKLRKCESHCTSVCCVGVHVSSSQHHIMAKIPNVNYTTRMKARRGAIGVQVPTTTAPTASGYSSRSSRRLTWKVVPMSRCQPPSTRQGQDRRETHWTHCYVVVASGEWYVRWYE